MGGVDRLGLELAHAYGTGMCADANTNADTHADSHTDTDAHADTDATAGDRITELRDFSDDHRLVRRGVDDQSNRSPASQRCGHGRDSRYRVQVRLGRGVPA